MKTATLVIVTVLLAGFAGSTFAQGYHHHHYRGSDGVVLATEIVNLVKSAVTPPVVVASPAVCAEPVVYSTPVVYPVEPVVYSTPVVYPVEPVVYSTPVYCAPPRPRHCRPAPPPHHHRHHHGGHHGGHGPRR